jgi:hypothetical protein
LDETLDDVWDICLQSEICSDHIDRPEKWTGRTSCRKDAPANTHRKFLDLCKPQCHLFKQSLHLVTNYEAQRIKAYEKKVQYQRSYLLVKTNCITINNKITLESRLSMVNEIIKDKKLDVTGDVNKYNNVTKKAVQYCANNSKK